MSTETDTSVSNDKRNSNNIDDGFGTNISISTYTDTGICADTGISTDTDTGIITDNGTNTDNGIGTNSSISTDTGTGIITDNSISTDTHTDIGTDNCIGTDTDTSVETKTGTETDTDLVTNTGISSSTNTGIRTNTAIGIVASLTESLYKETVCWDQFFLSGLVVKILQVWSKKDSNDRSVKLFAVRKRVRSFDLTKYFLRLSQALEHEAALCRRMRVGLQSGGGSVCSLRRMRGGTFCTRRVKELKFQSCERSPKYAPATSLFVPLKREPLMED